MRRPNTQRRAFIRKTGATAGLAALATAFGGNSVAATETMELNQMGPTPEQMQKFLALPDRPVVMVNLLKFKDAAGAKSYSKYGQAMQKILEDIGAELIFSGQCQTTLIGGAEWDSVALVRYPNARSLLKMTQLPEYRQASVHRGQGLHGQVNLAVFER